MENRRIRISFLFISYSIVEIEICSFSLNNSNTGYDKDFEEISKYLDFIFFKNNNVKENTIKNIRDLNSKDI